MPSFLTNLNGRKFGEIAQESEARSLLPSPKQMQDTQNDHYRAGRVPTIPSLDQEIGDHLSNVRDSGVERSKREAAVGGCIMVLPPVHLLPENVLRAVFLCSSPETPAHPRVNQAPMNLCQVCSAWRVIALDLSALWVHLIFPLRSLDSRPGHLLARSFRSETQITKRHGELLQFWFGNSKNHLALTFQFTMDKPQMWSSSIFNTGLMPFASRLQSLSVKVNKAEDLGEFLYLPSEHLPVLETLSLRITKRPAIPPKRVTAFECAPRLSNVTLQLGSSMFLNPTHPLVPWAQLISLDMSSIYLRSSTWYTLIRQCHLLQIGVFLVTESEPENQPLALPSLPLMSFNHLSKLAIRSTSDNGLNSTMFEGLHFPVLNSFLLAALDRWVPFHWDNSILVWEPSNLTNLVLGCIDISARDIISLLASTHMLDTLGLDLKADQVQLADFLTHSKPDPPYHLPRLTSLHLKVTVMGDIPDPSLDLVISMIRSRRAPPAGCAYLSTIRLYIDLSRPSGHLQREVTQDSEDSLTDDLRHAVDVSATGDSNVEDLDFKVTFVGSMFQLSHEFS